MNEFVSLIGSLGFPIVVCLFLLNYIKTFFNELTKTLAEIKTIVEMLKNDKEGNDDGN